MNVEVKSFSKNISPGQINIFSSQAYLPRLHYHQEYEIFFLDKGKGVFRIEQSLFSVSEGEVIFVEPKKHHCFVKTSDSYHYYAMVFDSSVMGFENDVVLSIINGIKIRNQLNFPPELLEKFKDCFQLEQKKVFGWELQSKSFLFEIFNYIISSEQYIRYTDNGKYYLPQHKAVLETCDYIKKHYKEKIDYTEIIKNSNYSKSQFIKIFKKQTGMNVTDFILKCRIENACLELVKGELSITEIAIENGFNNIQYFSKKFKEFMKCSPREYKKNAAEIMV